MSKKISKAPMFLLACFRDNVGSNTAFHGVDGRGYVTDINKAHRYTFEEAQKAWGFARSFDQPISLCEIEKHLVTKVDCQKLPIESVKGNPGERYYGYIKGKWDGNDVYWLTSENVRRAGLSVNYAKAWAENECDFNSDNIVYLPVSLVEKHKRDTFNYCHFNARKMVQNYGLRVPERIKQQRRRAYQRKRLTGKFRMNCPACGKINWQYDPHAFGKCLDESCEGNAPTILW